MIEAKSVYFSRRILLLSIGYIMVSLLLVNLGNEGGKNTFVENLAGRGWVITLLYYSLQLVLFAAYLLLVRLSWVNTLIVVALVILLRASSNATGIAILTIAIVLGRDFVNNQSRKES